MTSTSESAGQTSFGEILRSLVRVVGYCRFAHPDPASGRAGIPFEIYTAVFDELCRQYYPHDHMDRPLCAASYGPPCEAAWGPELAGERRRLFDNRRPAAGTDRHLYSYLVDDRKIIAGALTSIDRHWARQAFNSQSAATDAVWLARLGYALHGIEDFFAHSNFVEHAVCAGGNTALRAALSTQRTHTAGSPPGTDLGAVKVERRLKRYVPGDESRHDVAHPREDSVVTGYFDAWDTLNSLLHVLEELIRPAAERAAAEQAPAVVLIKELGKAYLEETIGDVLDMFNMLEPPKNDSFEVKARRAMAGAIEYFSQAAIANQPADQSSVVAHIEKDPILRALPTSLVRNALAPAVLGLIQTVKAGKQLWTIYQGVKTLDEFAMNPTAFLLKPLREDSHKTLLRAAFGITVELAAKPALVRLNYVLLEKLHELFRADRIGCHSLLAKDTPVEPLFDQMFACARHVDWYITDALCRWADAEWVKATSAERQWILWDELLAYYLRAPVDTPRATIRRESARGHPTSITYIVKNDDDTMRSVYERVTLNLPPGQLPQPYESMLNANLTNFDTSGVVKRGPIAGYVIDERGLPEAVIRAGLGFPRPRGYSLIPGIRLVIPVTAVIPIDVIVERDWYRDAMEMTDDGWRRAAHSYETTRLRESPPMFSHHQWSFWTGTDSAIRRVSEQFIAEAALLKETMEAAYDPR